ncbi:hypothetical protein IMZ48_31760 [Candidatus Bathyarchaeota archaeon]|nr:hypothetical protein [Candidatus Bathyarchaeota archaeon]
MSTPPIPTTLPDASNGDAPQEVGQVVADIPAQPTLNGPGDAPNGPSDANTPQSAQVQTAVTPEPRPEQLAMNNHLSQTTPGTPGLLPPFDWEDFQDRYEKALADADEEERAVLKEFEDLSKVSFGHSFPASVSQPTNHFVCSTLMFGLRPLLLTTTSELSRDSRRASDMSRFPRRAWRRSRGTTTRL